MEISRRTFLAVTAGSAVVLPVAAKGANDITLLVPGDAGSRTGRLGRMIATGLAAQAGGPIEIVNFEHPADAYLQLSRAAPDGRTLGIVTADITVLHWRGLSDVGPSGLTPLAMLATDPAGIHLRASDQVKTYRDLVADLKARPGQRRISGSGRGAIWHLAATRWQQSAGIGLHPWIAAGSPREAIADLAAGDTDVVVCSLPEARGTSQARAVTTIGVMNAHRSLPFPAVPAIGGAGVRLDAGWWRGVAGPPGLSSASRAQLTAALSQAYVKSALASAAHNRGFSLTWADARTFGTFMAREDVAMGAALRAAGIG